MKTYLMLWFEKIYHKGMNNGQYCYLRFKDHLSTRNLSILLQNKKIKSIHARHLSSNYEDTLPNKESCDEISLSELKCFRLRFAISNHVLIYRTIVSFVEDRDRRAMSSLSRIRVGKGDPRRRWRYDRSKRGALSRAPGFRSRWPIAPGVRPWCLERLPVARDWSIDRRDQS